MFSLWRRVLIYLNLNTNGNKFGNTSCWFVKKMNLKDKKEKNIWETAFISFLLEQKNNENFTSYSFEEIEKDANLDIALEESFDWSIFGLLFSLFLVSLLKIFLVLFSPLFPVLCIPLLEDDIINMIMNLAFFISFLLFIYDILVNKSLVKIAIKNLVKYCNYYKINKTVVIFLVEQKLTDMQNNILSLLGINQYKLNRENPKPEETTENTEPSTNEVNGILNSIKGFFWKKDKEEHNYDYLKVVDYIQDYKEYLEHQEDKKSN